MLDQCISITFQHLGDSGKTPTVENIRLLLFHILYIDRFGQLITASIAQQYCTFNLYAENLYVSSCKSL